MEHTISPSKAKKQPSNQRESGSSLGIRSLASRKSKAPVNDTMDDANQARKGSLGLSRLQLQQKRRISSVVENTQGGDINKIRDIIFRYNPSALVGVLSEGKQSEQHNNKIDEEI